MSDENPKLAQAKEFIECGMASTYDQTRELYPDTPIGEATLLVLHELIHFHTMVRGYLIALELSDKERKDMLAFSRKEVYTYFDYLHSEEEEEEQQ